VQNIQPNMSPSSRSLIANNQKQKEDSKMSSGMNSFNGV
jgi:hypothetical protein